MDGAATAPAAPQQPSALDIWRRYDDDEQRLSSPLSERIVSLASLRPGLTVLDLASGRGEPALRVAHALGPSGRVLCLDTSAEMLSLARERAARERLHNVELRVGDICASLAELGVAEASFDVVTCRWGLMYVAHPLNALRNVHRALRPGGRLVAVLWGSPATASFWSFPRDILSRHAPAAVPPIDPATPSTFYYADPARFRRDAADAGLRVVHEETLDVPVMEAKTADELIAWCRAFGLGRLLAKCDAAVCAAWEADVRTMCEAHRDADGYIRLGGRNYVIVADKV